MEGESIIKLNHDPQFDSGNPERVEFVRHTVRVAARDKKLALRGHVGAEGLSRVLLELAVDHFAERGKNELIAWELGSSQDFGKFLFELSSQGIVEVSDEDCQEDFEGWFDLQTPPETWKLQW